MSWKFNKMMEKNIDCVEKVCGNIKIRGIEKYV